MALRSWIVGLLVILSPILAGCATAGFDEAAVTARFGPPEAHMVSEPSAPFASVLLLGDVKPPALTGGASGDFSSSNGGVDYRDAWPPAVDLYLNPGSWGRAGLFGPPKDAPTGIYRFTFPSSASLDCLPFDRFIAAR